MRGKTQKLQEIKKYGRKVTKAMYSWINAREPGMRKSKRGKP
jgi:hypothetical protein